MKICMIEGCDRKRLAKGWCRMHYSRHRRTGDPLGAAPDERSDSEKFGDLVWVVESGCWLWLGSVTSQGYGSFTPSHASFYSAHRWAYAHFVGDLSDGDVVDHKCFTRSCVNPDHLRRSSPAQNNSNRSGPQKASRTGRRNVHETPTGKWMVRVSKDRRSHLGGTFDHVEDAAIAASRLREDLFGEFAGRG